MINAVLEIICPLTGKKERWKCTFDKFPSINKEYQRKENFVGMMEYITTKIIIEPIHFDLIFCYDNKPNIFFDWTQETFDFNKIHYSLKRDLILTIDEGRQNLYFYECFLTQIYHKHRPGDHVKRTVLTEKIGKILKGTICEFIIECEHFEFL